MKNSKPDKGERELLEEVESGQYIPVSNQTKAKQEIVQAAQQHLHKTVVSDLDKMR